MRHEERAGQGLPLARREFRRGTCGEVPCYADDCAGADLLAFRELAGLAALEGPGRGRRVGSGPGVAWPKSRPAGCKPAALATESFPGCPPGPAALAARRASAFIFW